MRTLIRNEFAKLSGSLALLLAVSAPLLPGLLVSLSLFSARRPTAWNSVLLSFALPLWTLFLMPMAITALALLVAQIEHRARGWDHLFALPIDGWKHLAAKLVVILAVATSMTLAVVPFTWLLGLLAGSIGGRAPIGAVSVGRIAPLVIYLAAGASLMAVLQSWVALRWRNFVVPMIVGIAGTMVALAVAMTRTVQADWFPWVIPYRIMLSSGDGQGARSAIVAVAAAVAVIPLVLVDLRRAAFR